MKSKAEYRERRIKYMINACFSWARLSEEERAWYASRGISRDAYIRKHSRSNRRRDRSYQYFKKHGIIANVKRIRRGELPEIKE